VRSTDHRGLATFDDLPSGYYTLWATTPLGYYPTTAYPVPANLGQGEQLHLELGYTSDRSYLYIPLMRK
jgi:hypothetical protein